MFDLKKCRAILEADGDKYTDEEIHIIYDYLEEMAEISVSEYLKSKDQVKTIPIEHSTQ